MTSSEDTERRGPHSWPFGQLLRLAWPITVSMLSYSVMTLVDTLFIGRLGPAALSGLGLSGVLAFTMLCFPMGLLSGVKVLVSQSVGAGVSERKTKSYLTSGAWLGVGLGLVFAVLGQAVASLLPFVAATDASGAHAATYLSIRVVGAPAVLYAAALREHRHGLGDARLPMVAAVSANVANIILDYLFIVVLGLGVGGAAWASVLAGLVHALVMALARPADGWASLRRAAWREVRAVWQIGWPSGLQFLLEVGSFAAVTMMIAALTEIDMAAHQVAVQVIHFTFLPGVAVGEAATVLAGRAVGAARYGLVKTVAHVAMTVTGIYALACTVVLVVCGRLIAAAFTPDLALQDLVVKLLYIAAGFQILDAASITARSALRGAGDVRYSAVVGIALAWALTPPLTWLFAYHLGMGAQGGWLALCVEIVVTAGVFWVRIESSGYRPAAERWRREVESSESELTEASAA